MEFDVDGGQERDRRPSAAGEIPPDSKVASIIAGRFDGRASRRRDDRAGDRIIVIGSPEAAQAAWSKIIAPAGGRVEGRGHLRSGPGGRVDRAQSSATQGIRVRIVEATCSGRAKPPRRCPQARVFHADGWTRLHRARADRPGEAAVFAMREDPKNLYAATLLKLHGIGFTIGIVHEPISVEVFERAGIDVAVNPRP